MHETVQTLMVRTLSATGALRYVGRRPLGVGGDFAALTELTDFQARAEAAGPGAVINLRMIVRLVRERDATVVSTCTITAKAQAATTESGDIVDQATHAARADARRVGVPAWLRCGRGARRSGCR
nr:hypothetical protein [Limimaricola cinnabarinus]